MPNHKSANLLCSKTDRKHIIVARAAVVLAGDFPCGKWIISAGVIVGGSVYQTVKRPAFLYHTVTFELLNTINLNDFASAIFFTLPSDNPS
jgi:hypothetical protein